jgi:PKD repeat protein
MPEIEGNRYYRVLLDPDGVHLIGSQDLGSYSVTDFGQATFSPDGSWYIRNSMIGGSGEDDYLDIYRFDRCTGLLSDHQRFVYGFGASAGGGVIVSPNNRFLYAVHRNYIYQLDLEANDILASLDTIAVYDGFKENDFLAVTFFLGQSAPDGKIYFNCTNGTSFLHLIHNPNGQGNNCLFEQRGVKLPTQNASSLPNFPNYRLGPIDGSPCDTLGIDNLPLAAFNYYADSSDYLSISFWDYSYYEPTQWEWTFGDSESGSGQTPNHTYSAPGIYEVCLTASNDYGSDSICKLLEFSTTGVRELLPDEEKVMLFPNPASEEVTISFVESPTEDVVFSLYNALGQKVSSFPISKGQGNATLSLIQETPGIYFYIVESEKQMFGSGKLIISR